MYRAVKQLFLIILVSAIIVWSDKICHKVKKYDINREINYNNNNSKKLC